MKNNLLKWWYHKNGINYILKNNKRKEEKYMKLKEHFDKIKNCKKCAYGNKRTNIVYGEGDPDADVIFIGEGPGKNEDLQGRPFVGRAGKLLRKEFKKVGINEENVYIANITKCRPFNNEDPKNDPVKKCLPYLKKQIEIIEPKLLVTLGRIPGQIISGKNKIRITKERGQILKRDKYDIILLYHPSYLLRNRGNKRMDEFEIDLKKVKEYMN